VESSLTGGRRGLISEQTASWLLIGFGVAAFIGSMEALRTGRIPASYRKWGVAVTVYIERDVAPIQFMIRVILQFLTGAGLMFFGAYRLAE
jgi:hypothetical protein